DRAQRGQDHEEKRARELKGVLLTVLFEHLRENGHERGTQSCIGEQAAHEVRELEGERERRRGTACSEVTARHDLAYESRDAAQVVRPARDDLGGPLAATLRGR